MIRTLVFVECLNFAAGCKMQSVGRSVESRCLDTGRRFSGKGAPWIHHCPSRNL